MPETAIATPLKEAIRSFWNAERTLAEAQREEHDSPVVANREEAVRQYEALMQQLQAQTTTIVLTGDDGCDYGDERITIDAIEMLLQRGIVHECLACEEREDLADCYGGDHREFHMSGDHMDACIEKALHEYDPLRWTESAPPVDEMGACEACGSVEAR